MSKRQQIQKIIGALNELARNHDWEVELLKDITKGTVIRMIKPRNSRQTKEESSGYLIAGEGSSIERHAHGDGIEEEYRIIAGKAKVNGKVLHVGENAICQLGKEHDLKNCSKKYPCVVRFTKRKEKS